MLTPHSQQLQCLESICRIANGTTVTECAAKLTPAMEQQVVRFVSGIFITRRIVNKLAAFCDEHDMAFDCSRKLKLHLLGHQVTVRISGSPDNVARFASYTRGLTVGYQATVDSAICVFP